MLRNQYFTFAQLKNGEVVPMSMVIHTMNVLDHLMKSNMLAFFELTKQAKDPKYILSDSIKTTVENLALTQNDIIKSTVKDVLLSAINSDGFDMKLYDPVIKTHSISFLAAGTTMELCNPVDATLAAKTLSYLANNKYKALFMAALVTYGIYDHYYDNGKMASAVKNGFFSLWQKITGPSTNRTEDQDNDQMRNVGISFMP